MAFELNKFELTRIYYEAGATKVFKLPRGNLYKGVNLFIQAEIDLTTGASNAPDFQVARMISEFRLVRNSSDTIMSLSGEGIALLFSHINGVEAPSNSTLNGTAANNKQAQHYVHIPFDFASGLKPWDGLMDTRKHDYEIQIVFRDLSAAGTLFGTISGAITAGTSENYIDIEAEQITLRPSKNNVGAAVNDEFYDKTPFIRGLVERRLDVTQNNTQFQIDLPKHKNFRNLYLWTVHEANTNQIVGENDIFSGMLEVKDTQQKTYHRIRARNLRQETGLKWGNTSLNAGLYHLPITAYGALTDVLKTDSTIEMFVTAEVTKQTNATYVRAFFDTVELQ